MISPALLATVTNIKNNRLLSGEAKSALAPFIGKTFTLPLAFVSASHTFRNPFDPVYDDGHALIYRIESEETEVTVLLRAEENDRIDSLASDETFEAKATDADKAVRQAAEALGAEVSTEELIRKALGR
jgi:hypothetical protein